MAQVKLDFRLPDVPADFPDAFGDQQGQLVRGFFDNCFHVCKKNKFPCKDMGFNYPFVMPDL